jgi:hypothetical protein
VISNNNKQHIKEIVMKAKGIEVALWVLFTGCVLFGLAASVNQAIAAPTRPDRIILKPQAVRQLAKVTRPQSVRPEASRLLAKVIRPQSGCVVHSVSKLA